MRDYGRRGVLGRRVGVGWMLVALACGATEAPDLPGPVDSGGGVEACAAPEAVAFTWSIEPAPEDMSIAVPCTITEVQDGGGDLGVALACAESGGPRARTLWVSATPVPPRGALRAGLAVRLWSLALDEPGQGRMSFVRLETTQGALLVAAAEGGRLVPPDGEDLWTPFMMAAAQTGCMAEETACGAQARAAVDLRRAGGTPTIAQDESFAPVGDLGEAQLWVSAAVRGDEACVGPGGAWYSVGMMAVQ